MKLFAYYLPQYYPTPENDKFWGKGFTEWVNVKKAKPLFDGHKQPKIPTKFGYYNLLETDVINAQAIYAKSIGMNGFTFWHYWFGNRVQTLEKPAKILFDNKSIDIEYYFTWVNANWTKSWVGNEDEIIFKQIYDIDDYKRYFDYLLPYFNDSRYYKINNKPVLSINVPRSFEVSIFIDIFNKLATDSGYAGVSFVAPFTHTTIEQRIFFDYLLGYPPGDISFPFQKRIIHKLKDILHIRTIDYKDFVYHYIKYVKQQFIDLNGKYIPTFMPNWDNTPRYGKKGVVFINNKIIYMEELLREIYNMAVDHSCPFVLIKSWNEWAEGNFIEPDNEFGNSIGSLIRDVIQQKQTV